MSKDKQIPEMSNYEDMAAFWENHSLADYWDQTESADFEVSPHIRRHYLVAIDSDLLTRVQHIAQIRGVSTESLVNLLIEQRLHEVSQG